MPGLIGYWDPDRSLPEGLLEQMAEAISGPDYRTELLRRPWGGIGSVDHEAFAGGGRVQSSGAGCYFAVRGQVQGASGDAAPEDPLASAHALFSRAPSCSALAQTRGHFGAAVLDETCESLTLMTDRYGLYPLYVARVGRALLFASEQKAILATDLVPPVVDQRTLDLLLCVGEVCGQRTLIEGIETIPAATMLTASSEGIRKRQYWEYEYQERATLDWNDAVQRAGTALCTAIQRSCRAHTRIAVPLSGGLDSRFLLELAVRDRDVTAYNWGVEGCRDRIYARDVAQRLGVELVSYRFAEDYVARLAPLGVWRTEGLIGATNFHVLPYVHEVAKNTTLVLDGFGGDGVLGGNFIGRGWRDQADSRAAGEALWRWRIAGWWGRAFELFDTLKSRYENGRELFVSTYQAYPGVGSMDRAMAFLIDNRVRRNTIGGSEIFRSRMATAEPFFDSDFMEVIRFIPHDWRARHRFYLDVLRRFATRSAWARWQRTALPPAVPYVISWLALAVHGVALRVAAKIGARKPFSRMAPSRFDLWFRGALAPYVRNLLISERTLDRGWVPADLLQRAVALHSTGVVDASPFLGSAISLELFARQFVDDLPGSVEYHGSKIEGLKPRS